MLASFSRALLPCALLLTSVMAVSACSDPKTWAARGEASTAPAPKPATGGDTVYHCADGQTLRASYPKPGIAIVEYAGRTRTLKAAASAGARYVGEGLQWWTKGQAEGVVAPLEAGQDMALGAGIDCVVFTPPTDRPGADRSAP